MKILPVRFPDEILQELEGLTMKLKAYHAAKRDWNAMRSTTSSELARAALQRGLQILTEELERKTD